MSELEEKYSSELVVIGVHAGKFIAERETENIRAATWRLGITHPVVNDRQFRTWRAHGIQAWPTLVLVSPDGQYIGQHAGEITFEQFDPVIEKALQLFRLSGIIDDRPLNFEPDRMPPKVSPLRFPGKVACDPASGLLFVSDTCNNRVLAARVDPGSSRAEVIHTIGGGEAGFQDGPFSEARLQKPEGLAVGGSTLYIADTKNHAIRAADLESGSVRTVAGTGKQSHNRSGGAGPETALSSPWDLLINAGWLYIAMAGTHQLWRMELESGLIEPFVGNGRENIDDGPNPNATLAQPSGLTTDGSRLIFADSESSSVRASDFSAEGYTQTLVGAGLFEFGDKDGKALQARLEHCLGVAYHNGKIYIADTYNNKIKALDLRTKEVSTLYGSGSPELLYEPGGLSIWAGEGETRLYVADTNSHRILQFVLDSDGALVPPTPLDFILD